MTAACYIMGINRQLEACLGGGMRGVRHPFRGDGLAARLSCSAA